MSEVSITELRQNLPKYLAMVRDGQKVRITSHGKLVAEITPPSRSEDEVLAQRAILRNSVLRYQRPFDPAFEQGDWDVDR